MSPPDNTPQDAERARQQRDVAPQVHDPDLSPVVLVEAVEPVAIGDEYHEPGERFQARLPSVEQAIARGLVERVEPGEGSS